MRDNDDSTWAWQYDAACKGEEKHAEALEAANALVEDDEDKMKSHTEMWFPPRDANRYQKIAAYSKSVCRGTSDRPGCPVKNQCLKEAIERDEDHGIFGGFSHRERNALVRKLNRKGITLDEYLEAA